MKVLFLDVDGVLNMHNSGGTKTLNRKRLRLLQEIVDTTGCNIVVSSSWRNSHIYLSLLQRTLKYRNMSIYSITRNLSLYSSFTHNSLLRGNEIKDWIDRHPDVEQYAIVDDNNEMLDSQQQYFVQTDPNIGLTKDITNKLIQILS